MPEYSFQYYRKTFVAAPQSPSQIRPLLLAVPFGLAVLLLLAGYDPLIGVGTGLLGCLLLGLSRPGLEFTPDCRSYREYHALFGWRFGRWQLLPKIVGVTLKYFTVKINNSSKYRWNSTSEQSQSLIIMLSVENKQDGIIVAYFSIEAVSQAIVYANELADTLHVPVNLYLPPNQLQ